MLIGSFKKIFVYTFTSLTPSHVSVPDHNLLERCNIKESDVPVVV